MNIFYVLAICAMLSPILYTVMWILGGILRDDYSHIRDDVSSLVAVGAPNKRLFDIFLISSSILLLAFFVGLHWSINNSEGSIVGPILLIISSVLGVLVSIFFPLDAGGEIETIRGKMHLILVIAMGILTIAGMVALWLRLRAVEGWSGFAIYSLIAAIISLLLVAISVIFITSNYMGLIERFMVSSYQVYYFVIGLMVFLNN